MCVMCNGASHADFVKSMMDKIERNGWAVIAVPGRSGFAYTVGLTMMQLPELWIEKFPDANEATGILNYLGNRQVREGELVPGQTVAVEGRLALIAPRGLKKMAGVKILFSDDTVKPTALAVQMIGSQLGARR